MAFSSSSSSPPRLFGDGGSSSAANADGRNRGGSGDDTIGEAVEGGRVDDGGSAIVVGVGRGADDSSSDRNVDSTPTAGDDVTGGSSSVAAASSGSSSPSSPSSSASSPKSVAVVGDAASSRRRQGPAAPTSEARGKRRPRGRGRGGYALVGGEDDSSMDDEEEGTAQGEICRSGPEKSDAIYLGIEHNDEEEDWIDRVIGRCLSRVVPMTVRSSPLFGMAYRACTSNLTSDEPPTIRRRRCGLRNRAGRCDDAGNDVVPIPLFAGPGVVRLFKFFSVTMVLIVVVHWVVRLPWLDWEHDADYTVRDFILYDMNAVCLDLTCFFIVGRLFDRGGVDRLFPFLVPMIIGAFSNSVTSKLRFLKYSFSLYEVVCHWPWQLFLYVAVAVSTWTIVVTMHLRTMESTNVLLSRLVEVGVTIVLFLLPYVTNDNFHFHHWYASWMLGMHANLDRWWSLATLAFVWGNYVNGVAVWGRDPILGCSYSFYLSTDGGGCNYMECYKAGDDEDGGFLPFVSPDWRNCSAEQNYIP